MPLLRYGFMVLLALLAVGILAVAVMRGLALRDDEMLEHRMMALGAQEAVAFDPAMLDALPEPARRYLSRAIAPGTPLVRVVSLRMEGNLNQDGQKLAFTAEEILSAPLGFLWRASLGSGAQLLMGSEAYGMADEAEVQSWTRFSRLGIWPRLRDGGSTDHLRFAAGRAMMEAVWLPTSLTPQAGAAWRQTGADSAEVRFPDLPDLPPLVLTFGPDGLPLTARTERWSDANADGVWRLQPFEGHFADWGDFDGFTIPVTAEFGTPGEEPFLTVRITEAQF